MVREKLLRDPIHDLISIDVGTEEGALVLRAINTHEVQRLRRIKQLGMAHMAYQGAEHSRFSHSIGVQHIVQRMLDRLDPEQSIDPLWRIAIRMAGLLHDLGHGPFSHVMEKFFQEHHEEWSKRIILSPETEIHHVLSDYDPQLPERIISILSGNSDPPWLHSLVNSQLDADRFDYLIRDSHMTGVKYGIFDLNRLVLMLRVDDQHVYVAQKGLIAVEKYLQSRYQMYRQVYFHKTVTAAESMLMALLERARDRCKEDGKLPGVNLESPLGALLCDRSLSIKQFLRLDDSVIFAAMNIWIDCDDEVLKDLSLRLLNRNLFKSVEISSDEEMDLLFEPKLNRVRDVLSDHGLLYDYYLKFSKSSDTPYRPYSQKATSVIWIEDPSAKGGKRDVQDVSPTISAFTESQYTIYRAFFPDYANGMYIRNEIASILSE